VTRTTAGAAADLPVHGSAEAARLDAVRRYEILDTPPDGTFDRVVALAARLFHVPIAIVSVVDHDRIWFKARHGLPDVAEIGRDPGLCASAVLQSDPWVVTDARFDPRTLANPLVAGEFGLRFYAGIPLTTADGFNLGTLCVIDRQPREVTEEEMATLGMLAGLVTETLEMRLAARQIVSQEAALRRHAESLADALQASLLPPTPPEVPGMELASRHAPGERGLDVGGDFYDVFRLAPNDWGVVVGDVCGKGARAASLTALARWTIRAAAVHSFLPSAVLAHLNTLLLTDDHADDDDHFCTAVFARMELDTCGAWVTLASAGHPRPIVVRRAGWIDLRGHVGLPLGMFDDAVARDDRVGLGPGDALVMFTDGISEARGPDGELFGEDCVYDVLLDCSGLSAETVADRLLDAATAFAGGGLRDDVAVLVLRVPDDVGDDPVGRMTRATGLPAEQLDLPGYPLGDVQPDLWREPPEPPREARIRLGPQAGSVPALRHLLDRLLRSWRLDALNGGDLELLASELATNAVVHAGGDFTVTVRYGGPVLRVEVADDSPDEPVLVPPSDDGLDGRGLLIVDRLASRWGVMTTHQGKRVWFEIDTGRQS
jgi:sigma-B regulation protein RsbU (phosphoserine phosphatase)